jgi:glycosyltransferase involved in cell wall biosynthesis
MPKVSVVIPTYNRPVQLRNALSSLMNQTFRDFEAIIIDDSTDDRTKVFIENYPSSLKKNLKYFRREKKGGYPSAINFGIKASSGELIAFLDDDDEWLPEKLARQTALMDKLTSETGVVHSNCFTDELGEKFMYHPQNLSDQSMSKLLEVDFIANSTAVIRKDCINKIGLFDERIEYGPDWDFYIRTSKEFKIAYIHEPLAILHFQPVGASRMGSSIEKKTKGYEMIITKHWSKFIKEKHALAHLAAITGSNLCLLHDYSKGRRYLKLACRMNFSLFNLALLAMNSQPFESKILQSAKNLFSDSWLNGWATKANYRKMRLY